MLREIVATTAATPNGSPVRSRSKKSSSSAALRRQRDRTSRRRRGSRTADMGCYYNYSLQQAQALGAIIGHIASERRPHLLAHQLKLVRCTRQHRNYFSGRRINPAALALEMLPDKIQEQARYLDEIPAPSVIALNSIAAGEAVNHFMLAVTNLHTDDDEHSFLHFPRNGQRAYQQARRDPSCPTCSNLGHLARDEDLS
ncbi:hypothetical protein P3102_18950 [Amycolatopsis sp. QT-25]|uniref:hypothetical protein n=1 Tax=Amycolatopsis sp. QT-25 TaxID=3034022 RepID=UPI0023EDF05F|nr:hypothetical protein [Amycolatopsis sp. QT-25]WET76218.1 hypothetical protein P3102_18950 [Amycolatopsis sp. QT-25]